MRRSALELIDGEVRDPRPECPRCRRPLSVCYCEHLPSLRPRNHVLLLQHPREQWTAIGTARMAHLALEGSTLRIATDFANDPIVQAALQNPRTYVLYPGEDAIAPDAVPEGPPITLIVVDGTWAQAQKLLRLNPAIGRLPRIGLTPSRPSEYQIRKQPAEFCVSTIEALAELLPVLERDARFDALREPFRAMVATQKRYVTEVGARRHAKPKTNRPTRLQRLAQKLVDAGPRLVCVQGDANGWARNDPNKQPAESVVWSALRPSDLSTFLEIIAPQRMLAPATVEHVGLSAETLAAGTTIEDCAARWRAFVRDDDVLVHWGRFYVELAEHEGIPMPKERLDLRVELNQALKQRVATVEIGSAALGAAPEHAYIGALRASRRLRALHDIVEHLLRHPL